MGSKKKLGDRLTLTVIAEEMVASLEDSFILSSIIISTTIRRNKKKKGRRRRKAISLRAPDRKARTWSHSVVVALVGRSGNPGLLAYLVLPLGIIYVVGGKQIARHCMG